jgi:hypothetical protein
MCRHFANLILTVAIMCALAVGQQRPQPPARTAPSLPPAQQEPLSDRDVIQMVESGKPEAAILATIRSSRTNFDLSPQGCRALAAAHVSRTILNAMGGPSQPPCSSLASATPGIQASSASQGTTSSVATAGSQQPVSGQGTVPGKGTAGLPSDGSKQAHATPAAASRGATPVALKPVKLAVPNALKKLSNPHLPQTNASIIAVLQQQRQAAEQEASAMKLAAPSASAAGTTGNSHQTAPSTRVQARPGVSQLGPESTQDSTSGLKIVNKPYAEPTSIACAKDPTPRVLSAPPVFTPEAKYNLFTISGCGFGATAAGNTAYIFGGNGFRENLAIDFWSERGITAHLDPALAGVLDQNNITLVVAPAGKQALQKSGFRFYAARGMPAADGSDQEVQLAYNSIPHSDVAIFNVDNFIAGFDQLPSNALSSFPSFSFQGTPVGGWVFRYQFFHKDVIGETANCYINDAGYQRDVCNYVYTIGDPSSWQLKSDTWDFSKFAPGFQITSYQLFVSTLDPTSLCGAWDDRANETHAFLDGNWDFNLNAQNQIVVTWPVYHCRDEELERENIVHQSAYGLAVWVMGPRCVDPWTGQKDQSCMDTIKKNLS